jgi:hypothetical protein
MEGKAEFSGTAKKRRDPICPIVRIPERKNQDDGPKSDAHNRTIQWSQDLFGYHGPREREPRRKGDPVDS